MANQSYKNHARFLPPFHFVLLPFLLINFVAMGYHFYQEPDMFHGWAVLTALALLMIALMARVMALTAQDRVIRLEERLRMRELFTGDLKNRINEFTPEQLIGLRFASDEELPELAATVLRDKIGKRDAIKKMVKHWRADDLRV